MSALRKLIAEPEFFANDNNPLRLAAFAGGYESGSPGGGAIAGALAGFSMGGPLAPVTGIIGAVAGEVGQLEFTKEKSHDGDECDPRIKDSVRPVRLGDVPAGRHDRQLRLEDGRGRGCRRGDRRARRLPAGPGAR